jgi:hypothetical protein
VRRSLQRGIPPVVGLQAVFAQLIPILASNSVQIPNHLAGPNRQFASKLLDTLHPSPSSIDKTKLTVINAQHSDISRCTNAQLSQLDSMNLLRRIPR